VTAVGIPQSPNGWISGRQRHAEQRRRAHRPELGQQPRPPAAAGSPFQFRLPADNATEPTTGATPPSRTSSTTAAASRPAFDLGFDKAAEKTRPSTCGRGRQQAGCSRTARTVSAREPVDSTCRKVNAGTDGDGTRSDIVPRVHARRSAGSTSSRSARERMGKADVRRVNTDDRGLRWRYRR
jgi:hypothetical protein